jgi:hypothetical protein
MLQFFKMIGSFREHQAIVHNGQMILSAGHFIKHLIHEVLPDGW